MEDESRPSKLQHFHYVNTNAFKLHGRDIFDLSDPII